MSIASTALADSVLDSANLAANYLLSQRNGTGSIGGFGYSAWALIGLTATGQTSPSTLSYLENNVSDIETKSATDIERTILAVVAGNGNPHNFGGKDLVAILKTKAVNNQLGSETQTNDDIYGILALLASDESISDPLVVGTIQFLVNSQRGDGSFSWSTSGDGDSNDTAAAIQALNLAQARGYAGSIDLNSAKSYLILSQNNDGGFGYQPGQDSDGSSTASIIPAIIALGAQPEEWNKEGNNPYQFLQTLQADTGGVKWMSFVDPDLFTTSFAAVAFARKTLPVFGQVAVPSPQPTPAPTQSTQPAANNSSSAFVPPSLLPSI